MQYFEKCISSKIYINCGIFKTIPQLLNQHFDYDKAIILIDENVFIQYENHFQQFCQLLTSFHYIKCIAGENAKNYQYAFSLIEEISTYEFTKNSLIIAIGGGTIGDLAGFIASILNRGLNFIQIPTTLMSQIDSAIGGKNGINLKKIKNKIGTIYFPQLIFIDPIFLTTVPQLEITSGLVEAIKHGLIDDQNLLDNIIQVPNKIKNNDYEFIENFIRKAAIVKIKIVNKDPYEKLGLRYILNLGHTFGHAIESFCSDAQLAISHGEAVAIGLNLVYRFAIKFSYLSNHQQFIQLNNIFKSLDINAKLSKICQQIEDVDSICRYIKHDKKNTQLISLILPGDGNNFKLTHNDPDVIKRFLYEEFYNLSI